jgi:hypothetical protein
VSLSLPAIADGDALYAGVIAPGAVTLSMVAIVDGDDVHPVTLRYIIQTPALGSTGAMYTPVVRIAGQALFMYNNGVFVQGVLKGYENGQWYPVAIRYDGTWLSL